jgi:hypothetical protein
MVGVKCGDYLAFFHDDRRFYASSGKATGRFDVFSVRSADGGLTWSNPTLIAHLPDVHLCEPGVLRSPDGRQIALLLRENARKKNSHVVFSNNEGVTWSAPREVPASLTGERHTAVYAPDGRLFISFRDMAEGSLTKGDRVARVGTYDDSTDCAYPGVVVLRDGTIVATTYGHWTQGEQPYILSVRLKLSELDRR